MSDIIKSMKLVGLYPDSFDEEIIDFIYFLAMRHSKNLEEIEYKSFMKVFDEDYNLIEDKKSIWESDEPEYDPSEDEGELESSVEVVEEVKEEDGKRSSDNIEDLD